MQNQYNEVTGRIFDIQKYSIHDGPGVRTIVFLKGCPLRCRWCCNPESQEHTVQTMLVNGKPKQMGRDVTVAEVMAEVCKDMPYYRRSGGGITLSGGEALAQPDFAEALLRAGRENGLSTAIETTGFAPRAVLERILPLLDVCLMDIKHMDSQKHEAFTGQSNVRILENAQYIAEHAAQLIIRVPVIPGFNDTAAEIGDIARFAASLPNVNALHLLPYHRMGKDKYDGLNRPYLMGDVPPPSDAHMQELLAVVQAAGLHGQIGG